MLYSHSYYLLQATAQLQLRVTALASASGFEENPSREPLSR
jgi:hypothetical protein